MFRQFLSDNGMEYNKENSYLARKHIKNITKNSRRDTIAPNMDVGLQT